MAVRCANCDMMFSSAVEDSVKIPWVTESEHAAQFDYIGVLLNWPTSSAGAGVEAILPTMYSLLA